jgi:hypothetical protein
MALIVGATAKQAAAEAAAEAAEAEAAETEAEFGAEEEGVEPEAGQPDIALLRQKAAAAAVAVALSLWKNGKNQAAASHPLGQPRLQPDGEPFSAWQPVLRANQLNQKSRMYSRKQRGNGQ